MTKSNKNEVISFEQGLARLEELIEKLENGELDLDESLKVFEEGVGLSRKLNQKLDKAEKKLELLLKDEKGEPVSGDFDAEPDEADEEAGNG